MNQTVVGNLHALAQKGSGNLRIKDRSRQHAQRVVEHFHILRAGMKHLERVLVGHKLCERRQVFDCKRIDNHALLGRCSLNQTQARVIRALAQKLGINRHGIECSSALTKRAKFLRCGDVHAAPVMMVDARVCRVGYRYS